MGETSAQAETAATSTLRGNLEWTEQLLRIVYGLFPIIAGLDKFTNILVTWTEFVPSAIEAVLPVAPQTFMYVIGAIEIVAGIIVFWRTEFGAYLVAAWLVVIALTQVIGGNFDIAVRDIWIAVGAIALAQLAAHKAI